MEGFDRLMGMGLPSKTKENSSSFYSGSSGLTRSRDSRTEENKAWRALWRGGKVKWWMVHCRGFRVGGVGRGRGADRQDWREAAPTPSSRWGMRAIW